MKQQKTTQSKNFNSANTLNIKGLKQQILNNIDPVSLLELFGASIYTTNQFEIRCTCPLHNGDNPTAFHVYTATPTEPVSFKWRCYTKCDDGHGDIIDFIMRVNTFSFNEAVKWLMTYAGIDGDINDYEIDMSKYQSLSDIAYFNKMSRIFTNNIGTGEIVNPHINENFVKESLARHHSYFEKRGYPRELLQMFEVGYCPAHLSPWTKTEERARIVIPLRDEYGKLVGISGRTIKDTKKINDKYNILWGSKKRSILYGLNLAMPYVMKSKSIILVEGFADVWRCWQYGKRNVVAICGKDVTEQQKRLVFKYASTVAIILDNDESGQKGADNAQNAFVDYLSVYRVDLPKGCDIGDLSYEEFRKTLKTARKVVDKIEQ